MSGCNCDNGQEYYLQCSGMQAVYSEQQVLLYTTRVGATGGTRNWVQCYAVACLRCLRLIAATATPGDCGSNTGVAPNVNQIIGGKLQGVVAADPEPISKAVIGIAAKIIGIFGANHAAAVQAERKGLCTAMLQYNQFADAMERAISQGAISVPDAIGQLQQVCSSLRSSLSNIVKPINAAYGMQLTLDALRVFNSEVLYPALKPQSIIGVLGGLFGGSSQQNGPGAAASTPADGSGSIFSTSGGKVFAVGAGIVGAKVLGVL